MHEWIKLTSRWGVEKKNPVLADLKEVLNELFAADKDDEHPDAWLECGSETGPLYVVSIFSSGCAVFTKYSDADMGEELQKTKMDDINLESGLRLWTNLIEENHEEIP
ncbi:hypothetical protein ACO0LD_30685 [Undibacterium sp. Ji83W]|uniref:hypothetical protein n=1 Tax=Undibacterium sp. Ji83W TaxID=3413043 RepID=UPI003BF20AFB